jgi:hypothetical protein
MKFAKSAAAFALAISAALAAPVSVSAHEAILAGNVDASSHAPIGVMGDHMHMKGEWMLSYRYMTMHMEGNRSGTSDMSPEQIVTTVPNLFAPPATLRVVPLEMTMQMHMLGAMYAPSDWLTLMAMVNYVENDMDLLTFSGMTGTTRLGTFSTKSSGIGDSSISALVRFYDDGTDHIHLNAGLSLPTGSIEETDDVLTPMNTRVVMRLPYSMQLGSGTYDLKPGITWTHHRGAWRIGAQYAAVLRLGRNSEDYSRGDEHRLNLWTSYSFAPWISASLRLSGETIGKIDGRDVLIAAPVQTANPDYYGGERVNAAFGVNLAGEEGALRGHRLAFEVGVPLYEDLNGPQMKQDWTLTVGWQKAF